MQGSPASIQHHRDQVLSQIEHLPTEGGKRAWRKPIETMELLDRHVAHLPPAQTIKLLQQMQVILSIKDTRTRDANLQQFAASLQLPMQRQQPQPAMHRQQLQPAMHRQQPRPAMQKQQPQPSVQRQQPQPAKLSFKDFEGLAALRPRPAAPVQAAHTQAPQYGRQYARPTAATPQPVPTHAEPELTLRDFERDAEKAADYDGHVRPDYAQAHADYASYLARRNPAPQRAASAPPRMQNAAAPVLSHHERAQIRHAEDERARYHNEMPNYQQAYADHLAQRPVARPSSVRRTSQAVRTQPRQLSAQEQQMIHRAEDERARYFSEMPDYAGAEARYLAQHGR